MDEWDDELADLPVDRRRIALRRGAYLTLCAGLIVLIILTILFVGNDTTTVAQVATAAGTSTTVAGPSTTGFATSLPVGVTATSLSGGTTTSSSTTTTLRGVVVNPQQTTTTTAPKTTTTTQPPFFYPTSHNASGNLQPQPGCGSSGIEDFVISTPKKGELSIQEKTSAGTSSISPSGTFSGLVITALKHTYSGTMPLAPQNGTQVQLNMTDSTNCHYTVTITFAD